MINWFGIYVFIVVIFVLGVSILNAIYYDRIRKGTCNAVTKKEAETGFWMNIIIAILSGILVFWSLFWIFTYQESKEVEVVVQDIGTKKTGPIPTFSKRSPSKPSAAPSFPGT